MPISIAPADLIQLKLVGNYAGAVQTNNLFQYVVDSIGSGAGAPATLNEFAAGFIDSTARATSSFARSGERTSINSANHQVRIGGSIRAINSGNAVRFAIVVVPNLFASANPSAIDVK